MTSATASLSLVRDVREVSAHANDEHTVMVPSPPLPAPPALAPATNLDAPQPHNDPSPVFTAGTLPKKLWKRLEALVGRGAVALFGTTEPVSLARLSTGMAALDEALNGGLPKGRLVEIAGPPAAGKTRLALQICASVQRAGGVAAVVDADHGLELSTLLRAGVNADQLVIARPEGGEAALHVVDELLRSRAADVIVIDSVAALVPRAELLGITGSAPAGHHARLMSQAVRRLTMQAARTRTVVVFVNQLRRNWGEDGRGFDITTGGNALVYAAATRLFVSVDPDGEQVRIALKKARFGAEGRVVRTAWPARIE